MAEPIETGIPEMGNQVAPIANEPSDTPDSIQYYEIHYYIEGNEVGQKWGSIKDYETIDSTLLPEMTSGSQKVVWYWDAKCTTPVQIGDRTVLGEFTTNGWTSIVLIYGRYEEEPMKVLTEEGVKILFNLLSLQDYPNNDVLMAVINAIDNTKLDKSNIFVGTQAEYREAVNENKISVGAIVVLTDVD